MYLNTVVLSRVGKPHRELCAFAMQGVMLLAVLISTDICAYMQVCAFVYKIGNSGIFRTCVYGTRVFDGLEVISNCSFRAGDGAGFRSIKDEVIRLYCRPGG